MEKMNQRMKHRGPDASGIFVGDGISLGHNRLSIIDLSEAANQPMTSSDGRYVTVYNGELYNFQDIKKDLPEYEFRTSSDTEVVMASYDKWGAECLSRFNGIFSFAIWDAQKKELFMARDRFGVKPFYYYNKGGRFVFASEAKAVLAHDFVRRELNAESLNNYFRTLYVLEPNTMWRDIMKLPPGHCAILKNNELKIKKYFEIKTDDVEMSYAEAVGVTREKVLQAVKRQMISDRPVGLFLSGGLDSSIICAAMAGEAKAKVRTFSVGFDIEIEKEKYNADFEMAKRTAEFFGAQHAPILISGADLRDNFEKCAIAMDEPVSNHIQTATYLLAQAAKKEVAVVLGGDGGDELFGGYDRYFLAQKVRHVQMMAPFLQHPALAALTQKIMRRKGLAEKLTARSDFDLFLSFMAQKENTIAQFLRPKYNNAAAMNVYSRYFSGSSKDIANAMMAADAATWLADESLIRSDKLTMAHGLEERVPFLDNDVADLAFSMPSKYKLIDRHAGKRVLRDAFRGLVPDAVIDEPKRGFFSPASKWLRTDLRETAYAILSPEYTDKTADLFDWAAIGRILDGHMSGEKYALNTIWSLMTFQAWARNYL